MVTVDAEGTARRPYKGRPARTTWWALPLLCVACSAGQTQVGRTFSAAWVDDHGEAFAKLEATLRDAPRASNYPVAVGVTDAGLVGVPLGGGSVWTFQHVIASRPVAVGSIVVGEGDLEVFAVRASNGELLWKRGTGGLGLIGAGDDGTTTIVTLEGHSGASSTLLAITRTGEVLRQQETTERLGRPAVIGGIAFVPWHGQFVTAFDVTQGVELARVDLRVDVSQALIEDGHLFFGQSKLVEFDAAIRGAATGAATIHTAAEMAPFGEGFFRAPWDTKAPAAVTSDKRQLVSRVRGEGRYGIYHRAVAGLIDRRIDWVELVESDILAAGAYDGGVATCEENGKVHLFERERGVLAATLSLGGPVRSCVVAADGLSRAPSGGSGASRAEQIQRVLAAGPELAPLQGALLPELLAMDDDDATRVLIELAVDPRTSDGLVPKIRDALRTRRSGVLHMLAALQRPYDYLHDVVRTPPVGPLATALAAAREPRAAGPLARLLLDAQTPAEDLAEIARALVVLATPSEGPDLESFFALYRATAESPEVVSAVVAVAKVLLRVGGAEGRDLVERAAKDPMTLAAVRAGLTSLLSATAPP